MSQQGQFDFTGFDHSTFDADPTGAGQRLGGAERLTWKKVGGLSKPYQVGARGPVNPMSTMEIPTNDHPDIRAAVNQMRTERLLKRYGG